MLEEIMPESVIAEAPYNNIQGEDPNNPSPEAILFAQQTAETRPEVWTCTASNSRCSEHNASSE
jgi:hypothetical protein